MMSPNLSPHIEEKSLVQKGRRALKLPLFEITDWQCVTLTGHISNPATGGLYRVFGTGCNQGSSVAWSLILKIAHLAADAPEGWGTDLLHFGYWKREALAYRSGVLETLTPGLQAPHCFAVEEQPDGSVWLWLSEVKENSVNPWPVARYGLAARHFGEWQGAYLAGSPLPDETWLQSGWLRSWVDHFAFLTNHLGRAEFWEHPLAAAAFHPSTRERLVRFWKERDRWLDLLDTLPQTVCHFDLWRPNLFACGDSEGRDLTVALDWQCIALGPAGEVGNLLATSLMNLEIGSEDARSLDCAVWEGYLAGLRTAGWTGDPRAVRFAYAAYPALRWGAVFPMLMVLPCVLKPSRREEAEAKYGKPIEALLQEWAAALDYILDLAEEARLLADGLTAASDCRSELALRI